MKKPEERRSEIMAKAKELFLTRDYEAVSMSDIMKSLHIAKGTVYHYFDSKEHLLNCIVEEMVAEYIKTVQEKVDQKKNQNALIKLASFMQALGQQGKDSIKLRQNLHKPGNILLHTKLLAVTIRHLAPLFADILYQGDHEGCFVIKNPLETAEFILAGMQFMTDVGVYPWSDEEILRREKAMALFLETQFEAPANSIKKMFESK